MTLDNINPTEESLIDELRNRLKGHMTPELYEDDLMFRRFLRARNHNLNAAEGMLRNHLNWRKKYKVDKILTEFTPHKFLQSDYFTLNHLGEDLEGSPVSYVHFGGLDPRGLLKTVTKEDILTFLIQYLETDMASMQKRTLLTGKEVSKCCYIFNLENFSLAAATDKSTIETLGSLISFYEGNFPERLKTAYLINVSYYFTLLWSVLRQFLSPATRDKIKFYGKTGWQDDILSAFSPDILPAFLGGNLTDPDGNPLCKTIIKYGGPIPQEYYKYSHQSCETRLPGARKLHIHRNSKAEVTLNVPRPGSIIEWEFFVKKYNIAFSVWYKEGGDSDPSQVLPQQRVEGALQTESGMYRCEKPGFYIIEFDNTFSWMHSKEIYYTATVVPPAVITP